MYQRLSRPPRQTDGLPPLLVLLHGYASNMQDLFGLAPTFDRRLHVVALQAPLELGAIGIPGGRAWFHLDFLENDISYCSDQVHEAVTHLAAFLPQLATAEGCDPDRTYLLGFSQGSMMAHGILQRHANIAGIIGLSGRMAPDEFSRCEHVLKEVPVFIGHGRHDPLLPIHNGRQIAEFYDGSTEAVLTYREYDMAHEINMQCLTDVNAWLKDRLDG
ncbi:MAG TPA: carboxylesterase [Lentisphaeria bacterium]|nr:carboxylesterase [Lentisphaeria bacterium]